MINVALIGLGRIGQMHAENLFSHKSFNLKYTFDINTKLNQKISKKFNSTSINNPKIAFKDKNIDLIFIASSTSTHIKLIEEAVKYKKVIFCEKPLDLSIEKINSAFENFSRKNKILEITKEKLVSIDFNHNPASSIVDANLTNVVGKNMGKISAWYDNEWGFSNRMCDIAKYLHKIS